MDSSPPPTDGEWPTPSKRTSRVLSKYAHMSVRKIATATGIPKPTVQNHLKAPPSRTRNKQRRGRKCKVVFTDEIHFARNNCSVDYIIRGPSQRFYSDCIQVRRQTTKVEYSV
jgi:DNA-binding transcriptional ArsR family regulator